MYILLNNNSLILGLVQSRFPAITENNIGNTNDQQYRIRRIRNFTFIIIDSVKVTVINTKFLIFQEFLSIVIF